MFNIKECLLSIGLTEEEIIVYIATLQADNETVLKIAQNTGIPRTTVYLLIESLMQKGFIRETAEGKKKQYIPASPDKIVSYVTAKKQQFAEIASQLQKNIPSIQALYNFNHGKPEMLYYEGHRDVSALLQSVIGTEELCLQLMSDAGSEFFSQGFEDLRKAIQQAMIASREIVSDSMTDKHYMKTYANMRNQVRYMPAVYKTMVDYVLFADGMIHITYRNEVPMAICIRDKHIVHFEKVRFNLLWDHPLLQADNK